MCSFLGSCISLLLLYRYFIVGLLGHMVMPWRTAKYFLEWLPCFPLPTPHSVWSFSSSPRKHNLLFWFVICWEWGSIAWCFGVAATWLMVQASVHMQWRLWEKWRFTFFSQFTIWRSFLLSYRRYNLYLFYFLLLFWESILACSTGWLQAHLCAFLCMS